MYSQTSINQDVEIDIVSTQSKSSISTQTTTITTTSQANLNKRKPYVKKSIAWKNCSLITIKDEQFTKCSRCGKLYKWFGSTSNMKRHLLLKHQISMDNEYDDSSEDNNEDENRSVGRSKKKKYNEIDKLLVNFVVKSAQPLRIVENESFIDLLKGFDSNYKLPSRYIFTNNLLNNQYNNTISEAKNELMKTDFLTMSLDIWTSCQGYPYLGITVHYFDKELNLINRTLALKHLPGSHTNENICQAVMEIIFEYGIESKIIGLVTDNASNVRELGQSISEKLSRSSVLRDTQTIHHIGCNAHILNLIVKKLNQNMNDIAFTNDNDGELLNEAERIELDDVDKRMLDKYQNILRRCRKFVTSVHQSNLLSEALHQKQTQFNLKNNKLIQDVPTRWNSTFLLLERFEEQLPAINGLISDGSTNEMRFSFEDSKAISDIVAVLRCYYDATVAVSNSKFTSISEVLPIYNALVENMKPLEGDTDVTKTLKKLLGHYTKFYINKYISRHNSLYSVASYLDVRTKNFGRVDENTRKKLVKLATEKITEICSKGPENIKNLVPSKQNSSQNSSNRHQYTVNNTKTHLQYFDFDANALKKIKSNKYGLEKELLQYQCEPSKNIKPRDFWIQNKENYPCLYYCFKYIFSLPASSVPAEQLFSFAGHQISDRRNKLSPENANKIMVLYGNNYNN